MLGRLRQWHKECPKSKLDLVFPNEEAGPIDQSNFLKRHFYPMLIKAKIKRVRFHDLRHTYASMLIEQGESIKYIQNQMGHSSPTVTLNIYTHLFNPTNQESECKLERSILNTGSKMLASTKKGHTENGVNPSNY
jgi:integrase